MKLLFWLELGERRMPVAAVKSTDEERSRRRRVSPESAPWPPAPSRPQVSLPSVRLTNEEASRLRERRRRLGCWQPWTNPTAKTGSNPCSWLTCSARARNLTSADPRLPLMDTVWGLLQ